MHSAHLSYSDDFYLCVVSSKAGVAEIWAPGVSKHIKISSVDPVMLILSGYFLTQIAFEVVVFLATCWNAVERPRTLDTKLTNALYRDGIVYFLVSRIFDKRKPVIRVFLPLGTYW